MKCRWVFFFAAGLLFLTLSSPVMGTDPSSTPQARKAGKDTTAKPVKSITPPAFKNWTGDLDGMIERRLIRVFEKLRSERGLPDVLRTDNGPEFLSGDFVAWAESVGVFIQYIQPGEPNQNAYIERFNRTYREEVLNLYLFRNLAEVRETTYWWMNDYNELRPHDALDDMTPLEYMETYTGNSTFKLSA